LHYIEPDFLFTYAGFGWVQPWPGDGLYWHFAIVGLAALCIALGAFYRIATVVFFVGFSYIHLLDQARYLNHFYLVILIAFLMIFLPANRTWSVDAWLFPSVRSRWVPAIAVWTMRGQFEVMLIFAGLVKINPDWLRLEPLRIWLGQQADLPMVGHHFTDMGIVAVGVYGSILLHLIGAPLLLWRRTRLYVFALYCCFHFMNHVLFKIGIFPWLTIAGTLIFFAPDWPRRFVDPVAAFLRSLWPARATDDDGWRAELAAAGARTPMTRPVKRLIVASFVVWFAFQAAIPLRHFLYPGRASWTEEGARYSWHMMLRRKRGWAEFEVRDPDTGRVWTIDNRDYLSQRQIARMTGQPEMMARFARHLEELWIEQEGVRDVEVRVTASVSLNGRRAVPIVDPERDLTTVKLTLAPNDWILPLNEPLHRDDPAGRAFEQMICPWCDELQQWVRQSREPGAQARGQGVLQQ
ncbi:MAG: HTTM domain-containing protein, partial [Caulobacterales bacterium]|nr:HTTM domain-containing protein [Caulobacterales bacterium]